MKSKSNEPTKTKKAMKTMKKYLSMAALALVGPIMTGCSSSDDDSMIDNPQQPESKSKVVTLTTKVGFDGGATTRALSSTGKKTFAAGETMALVYKKNTGGSTVKVVSAALTDGDITDGGKSATFTFELTDPDKSAKVTYIYPAAMAKADGTVNYAALNSQDGTLSTLSSNLDLATYTGDWNAGALPTGTLTNHLAILAMTLKNDAGGSNITSSITGMTINEGSYTYAISGISSASTIYVAINPTNSANLEITATDGTKTYAKALSGKTYAANNGYNVTWKMAEVISGKFSVSSTKKVYFSKGNLRATTSDKGANWTWAFATNQWDKIGGRDQGGSGTLTGNNYINGNGTLSENGTVDLFGWSTSATHLGINNSTNNSTYSGAFADWGEAPEVTATIGTGWRTLTRVEWEYLLDPNAKSHRTGMQYIKAQVNGVNGLIVFPDNWSDSYHHLSSEYVNNNAISFENTKITESTWVNDFETHGAVFLPVAGQRHVDNNYVEYPNGRGHYWSSTPYDAVTAYRVYFSGNSSEWSYGVGSSRRFGYAVRLVRDVTVSE